EPRLDRSIFSGETARPLSSGKPGNLEPFPYRGDWVIGTTLQRMIFWELLRVFALALVGLTGLFLLGGVVQEASQRGLTPAQIVTVIPLLIPTTLSYTVPATILFATCMVFGRLAHDNEITALRSARVHLGRLMAPAVIFAIVISTILAMLQYDVLPR